MIVKLTDIIYIYTYIEYLKYNLIFAKNHEARIERYYEYSTQSKILTEI